MYTEDFKYKKIVPEEKGEIISQNEKKEADLKWRILSVHGTPKCEYRLNRESHSLNMGQVKA